MSLCCCLTKVVGGGALLSAAAAAAALAPSAFSSSSVLSFNPLTSRRSLQASYRTLAKRRPTTSTPLQHDDEQQVLDEDFRNSINEVGRRWQILKVDIVHSQEEMSEEMAKRKVLGTYASLGRQPSKDTHPSALSTEAVRTMLSENMKRMEDLQEKLFDLEIYFEKENEKDALLFVLVIKDMLSHKILPEAKQLKGIYLKAFQKICNMVEDSGWQLKGDDDESEVGMIDDELIPPTLMSEYR